MKKKKTFTHTQPCCSAEVHSNQQATPGITGSESENEGVREEKETKCNEEEVKRQEEASQRLSCVGGTPYTTQVLYKHRTKSLL